MGFLHQSDNAGIQLIDQATDLPTPASGKRIPYSKVGGVYVRDSTGTVLQFATSAGGMADAVILAPASSTRNVIQPTGDYLPLAVKRFSSGAVSDLFQVQDQTGAQLVQINSAGIIIQNGAAGTNRSIFFRTGTSARWELVGASSGAESGSNVGSDFALSPYSDAGSSLGFNPLLIARATGLITTLLKDAVTNAVTDVVLVKHQTSGTPAAGYGTGVKLWGNSGTVADRDMGRLRWHWTVATDASRTARGTLSAYDATAERDCFMWEASGSVAMLGFYGTAPIVRPSTTGETVGFTAGAGTTVTDASTFTGNVGATAYRISDIVKHLKNLGLIAA